MIRYIVCAVLCLSCLAPPSRARVITMDEFLGMVRSTHPVFRSEELAAPIELANGERYRGSEDWYLSAAPYLRHQEPLETSPFVPKSIDSFGFSAGVDRLFWRTGGRLSLSWSTDFTDQETRDIVIPGIITIPSGPSRFYQHGVFAAYSHPLLQNQGGRLDRLQLELNRYTVTAAELQSIENRETFLLDTSIRFLEWVLLTEQLRIVRERLELAEEQLEQMTRRWNANLIDKVDLLRAEDAVRIATQNVLLLQSQWKAKQAELATIAQNDEFYTAEPDFDLYETRRLLPIDELIAYVKGNARALRALNETSKLLSHQRDGFNNAAKPRLDLSVSAGLIEGDDGFGESLTFGKPDFTVGLNFIHPIGNRAVSADIDKLDLQQRQLVEDIRSVQLELESSARALHIQIREMERVLALNREQIESAASKTGEEIKLYNQGRSQLAFVIQSRDNEENSKFVYAENAATYHRLLLQYAALIDDLLPDAEAGER